MNDYVHISDRNVKALQKLIHELKINRSLADLVQNFDRLFKHDDDKTQRLRLLGIERTGEYDVSEKFDKEGEFVSSSRKEKKKQIQLYVLKKRDYVEIVEADKQHIYEKLDFFIILWKQLKAAYEIDSIEDNGYKLIESQIPYLIEEYVN